MNPTGHTSSLIASHPRNVNARRSGAFSRAPRPHGERADEIAEAIMSARHVDDLDGLAASEVGRFVSLIEAIDRDIERRGTLTRAGDPRRAVELRLRASARLEKWLAQLGMTPRARAEWAAVLAQGGLAAEIAKRRAESVGDQR